jgi:AmmeMemoRadiSam system protein A
VPILGKVESPEDRRLLLQVARRTAARELGVAKPESGDVPLIEGTFGGAFVTLWRGRMLRGCIGRFGATDDLVGTIEEMTRAALSDPRFVSNPVTGAELPALNIEVSILSALEPTPDPLALVPGTHGIVIRCAGQSGCFLPKVASDRGWSAEEFLSNCCAMKAGLPSGAWRRPEAEVLLFTAEVFAESDFE